MNNQQKSFDLELVRHVAVSISVDIDGKTKEEAIQNAYKMLEDGDFDEHFKDKETFYDKGAYEYEVHDEVDNVWELKKKTKN